MTFDTQKAIIGRQPFYVIKLYLASCDETFGTGACIATGDACFNTIGTCKYEPAFNKVDKVYTFCSNREKLPLMDMYPFIVDMGIIGSKRDPGKSLGRREGAQILLRDTPHHDRGIDPYLSTRSYDASERGTFWTKLLARNEYYTSKKCEVYVGYLTDDMTDLTNFEKYTYFIDKIQKNTDDTVTITVKDIFKLSDRATFPESAYSSLNGAITDSDTTIIVDDASDYASSGTVRIDNEIINYTGKTATTLTGCTRAQYGTTAAAHNDDASVQQCETGTNENVIDTIKRILNTCDVSDDFIPYSDWSTESASWLGSYDLNYCISKPEKGSKLINELIEQCMLTMWWDAKDAEIKLDAFIPALPSAAVTVEQDVMLKDSFTWEDMPEDKLSQYTMLYGIRDYADKVESENVESLYVSFTGESGENRDNEIRAKQTVSRWFTTTDNADAVRTTVNRTLNQKKKNPKKIKFEMDIRHTQPGSDFYVKHPDFINKYGEEISIPVTIVTAKQKVLGTTMTYEAISTGAEQQRYALIGPNTLTTYPLESDANKDKYGFISANSEPYFSDGTEAYKIL